MTRNWPSNLQLLSMLLLLIDQSINYAGSYSNNNEWTKNAIDVVVVVAAARFKLRACAAHTAKKKTKLLMLFYFLFFPECV